MPAAAVRRWALSSRPFYSTAFVVALIIVHSLFIQAPASSRHAGTLLSARAGEDCRLVHQAEDKCAFVKRNCHDDEAGLLEYLTFYYCTLGSAKPAAFVIMIAWLCLLFSTIGIAASDFFSVNLSTIATILGLSQSLAGVTFLAFGNGSPDVFSTFAAMGSNSGSMAVGELLGAAGFITSVVAGSMALVREFKVSKNSFIRDIVFFIVAVGFTFYFIWDGKIQLWECGAMIGFYVFYVIFVVVWHWYNKRGNARRARETASRSHFMGSGSLHGNDELEPYRDEPDDEEIAPGSHRGGPATVDIGILERGPRIEIGEPDTEDADDERNQHIAAEMASSMRVNRPRGRRSTTTITPIRPSLVGALEFRAVLSSLQHERNMRMAPIFVRSYSDDRIAVDRSEGGAALVGGPVSVQTIQGAGTIDLVNRNRSRSSGAIPLIMDEDLASGSPRAAEDRNSSVPPHTVGGMLAPPPTDSTGGLAVDSQDAPDQHRLGKGLHLRIPSPSPPGSADSTPAASPFPTYSESPRPMTPDPLPTLPTPALERHSPFEDLHIHETHRPVRWWPYRILPDPYLLVHSLFPTLQDWNNKPLWDKMISAWSVPSVLLLVLTLPVVESETTDDDSEESIADEPATGGPLNTAAPVSYEPNGSIDHETEWQQYRRSTRSRASSGTASPALLSLAAPDELRGLSSASVDGIQSRNDAFDARHAKPASDSISVTGSEDQGWNRWLLLLQVFTGPMFAVSVVWANMAEDLDHPVKVLVRMLLIALVFSLVILAVLLATTSPERRPKFHFLFCFLGFIIAIAWISTIAGEVVGVLKALGVIFNISEAILGLTIFAVGNSIGDLVADITVARLGYPVMALAACFGGPMLNILLGIGLGGAFQIVRAANKRHAKHPDKPFQYKTYHIQVGDTLLVSAVVLLITLFVLLAVVPMSKWVMTRRIGWGLIALWAVGTIVNLVIELTGPWYEVS
ncbi:Sodium/calcium exchanger protein-domain-containing protein [Truncatella angustata]|uniref:Sodium/calcium exchanger protein-domain-containing protein n=1 Tax=Truncatella angustata TaxID=152316 RepID=A0A9P8UXZ8_9PEZI|nr:Sodium/calcium exchanger protein-domain-containing protein [Truncatella angustata]KAH6660081.1 Sodium/calcium exchanger protein-domain-containing protein [Truncatella angustata]